MKCLPSCTASFHGNLDFRVAAMVSKKTVILGYDAVSSLGTDLESEWQRAVRG